VSEERVPARVISELIAAGQEMLRHPIELLPHAQDAVEQISKSHRVLLITKGDLLDQERKLAQSGLGDLFDGVEIVSAKNATVYRDIFDRQGDGSDRAMMVGNSMASDIRPVIEAGGWGVFVPHNLTWAVEHAEPPKGHGRYHEIDNLSMLSQIVSDIG
ncbi:MAG: HAD family hydrolase, partial [Pseudomonadota bacterium]